MIILGIDPGLSCTGWALVDGPAILDGGYVYSKTPATAETIVAYCDRVAAGLSLIMGQYDSPIQCVVEWPFERTGQGRKNWNTGDRSGLSLAKNAMVAADLRARLNAVAVLSSEWQPNTRGGADPQTQMILRTLKMNVTNEHQRDAIGLALWYERHSRIARR